MSLNYATAQPHDRGGEGMYEFTPAKLAASIVSSENASTSSVINLTPDTTTIEIHAIGGAAVAKWIATTNTGASVISDAGTSNFDIAIPANYYRRVVVPQETIGSASIVGINIQAGLYRRIAYKSVGVGSIITVQY